MDLPRNEALAQWVARAVHAAGGVDVVIGEWGFQEPRRPPAYAILAGPRTPPGHRHIVAVTDDWTVLTFAPGQRERLWVKTAADLDVVLARVIACLAWLRDDPARDGLADRALRTLVAVVERFPQRRFVVNLVSGHEAWITLHVDGRATPAALALREGVALAADALDVFGAAVAAADAFGTDADALRSFMSLLLRRLGAGWSTRDNFAYHQHDDVARVHVFGVKDDVDVPVAFVTVRSGQFVVDIAGVGHGVAVSAAGAAVDAVDAVIAALVAGRDAARGRVSLATLRPGTRVRLKKDVKGFAAGTDAVFVDTIQCGRDEFALQFRVGAASFAIGLDDPADDDVVAHLDDHFAF